MFKYSDVKVSDMLIASCNGNEYKVLETERHEDTYFLYVENLQNKARTLFKVPEGTEAEFGVAKIIHA